MSSGGNSTILRSPVLLAVTGTPGTGKTTICEEMARSGYRVIRLLDLSRSLGPEDTLPGEDRCFEVDVEELDGKLAKVIEMSDGPECMFVEGHLSHLLSVDGTILLRCDPRELRKRLGDRGYPDRKVEENCESELIDIIAVEVNERGLPAIELDTTDRGVDETGTAIRGFVDDFPCTSGFTLPGTVNWIKTIFES